MDDKLLKQIETRAFNARVTMTELCAQTHTGLSTISRWRAGVSMPRMSTIRKLEARLAEIEAKR